MKVTSLISGVALAISSVHALSNSQTQKYGYLLGRDDSTSTTTSNTTTTFNASSISNLAVYYGRAQNNQNPSLYDLCSNQDVDMVLMGFVTQFNGNYTPSFAFLNTCKTPSKITANTTVSCSALATNISYCQTQGKKVMLTLGGSSGNISLASSAEATQAAQVLWNVFGAGSGSVARPFGNISVDGFDFDFESGTNTNYTDVLASTLQSLFKTSETTRYISAAPLCANNTVLPRGVYANSNFVWPRFYNAKACCFGSKGFNSSVQAWTTYLSGITSDLGAHLPRVYLGGVSFDNSNSGYVDPDTFADDVLAARDLVGDRFGGVALWEGTDALVTKDAEGNDFLNVTKDALDTPFTSDACGRFDGIVLRVLKMLMPRSKINNVRTGRKVVRYEPRRMGFAEL